MTNKSSPHGKPEAAPETGPDLARFLQDWTELWRQELRTQAKDPDAQSSGVELWRAAMAMWTDALRVPPISPGDRDAGRAAGAPGAQTVAAASDARDAAIERLIDRVDELEGRLARLEATGRSPRHRSG